MAFCCGKGGFSVQYRQEFIVARRCDDGIAD